MSDPSLVGQTLGNRYVVEAPVGAGGMGVVYAVRDTQTGTRCAVKVLAAALATEADAVRRFWREANALAAVRHRGVVRPLDWGQTPQGAPFLVMELLQGETLGTRIERQRTLPWPVARAIFLEIAEALAAAHTAGVLHRDLKPANVFLARDAAGNESVRILDFGLAKALEDPNSSRLTATGAVLGTPAYMSPEQALAKTVGIPADVYSLATILFEMIAGTAPFAAPTPTAVLARLMSEPAPRLTSMVHGRAPLGADDVIARALEKQPEARYQRVEAFAAAVVALGDVPVMPATVQQSIGAIGSSTGMLEMATGPTVAFAATPQIVSSGAPVQAPSPPTASPFGIAQSSAPSSPFAGQQHPMAPVPSQLPMQMVPALVTNPAVTPQSSNRGLALKLGIAFVVAVGLCVGIVYLAVMHHDETHEQTVAPPIVPTQPIAAPTPPVAIPAIPGIPSIPTVPGLPPGMNVAGLMGMGQGNMQQCMAAAAMFPSGEMHDQMLFACALPAGQFDQATTACNDLRTHFPQNGTGHSCLQAIEGMRQTLGMMNGAAAVPTPVAPEPDDDETPPQPAPAPVHVNTAPLPFSAGQTWLGTYLCRGVTSQFAIDVHSVQGGDVRGTLRFVYGQTSTQGSFMVHGPYEAGTRHLRFAPGRWIAQPPGFEAVGLDGTVSTDGRIYHGTVMNPVCGRFELRR